MLPVLRRLVLVSSFWIFGTISTTSAAPQIDIEGRLNLDASPGGGWSDSFARFFDIDGDGDKDFACGGDDTDQSYLVIRAARGNGVYEFVHQQSWLQYVIPSAIAAGDLDGDGVHEIVYATAQQSIVVLSRGAYGVYSESSQFPIQSTYIALETGDLDGDGDIDIVGLRNDGTIRVHTNQNGAFPSPPSILSVSTTPRAMSIGDMNGDGAPDIVVASATPAAEVSVLLNLGNGTFAPALAVPSTGAPAAIVLADFDRDGALDVATTNPVSLTVHVWMNLGSGALSARVDSAAGIACQRIDAGDVNGDGEPDLVVTSITGPLTGGASVLVHAGSGSFAAPVSYATVAVAHAALTDLDADGDRDLALVGRDALRNRGDGTFAADAFDAAPLSPWTLLTAGDLDGDGDDDLVQQWSDGISERVNLGNGTFAPAIQVTSGSPYLSVMLADADLDGDLDMIVQVQSNPTNGIFVLVNQAGSFGSPIAIAQSANASAAEVADMDLDGRPDIVVKIGNGFSVARNMGGAT